jgi:DNA-binding NarL/FixJ family response regulator
MRVETTTSNFPSLDASVSRQERTRVVIVTEVRLYREGLGHLLAGSDEIDVVAVSAPSDAALRHAIQEKPHVVLADAAAVRTTAGNSSLAHLLPDSRVVVFALAEEDEDEVFACVEAGAAGFVGRDAETEELVTVIRAAARGEVMCSPKVAALFLRRIADPATGHGAVRDATPLTRREHEVLRLIDDDLSNKEIASRLGIEVATVKNHVHNILEKCHLHRREEAAAYVKTRRR